MFAASREDRELRPPSELDLRLRYEDRQSDQWAVHTPGAGVVGYGEGVFQERSGNCLYLTSCTVHPSFRGMGIGTSIIKEQLHRAEELSTQGARHPVTLTARASSTQAHALHLFQETGLRPVRYFFEMLRPLKAEIPSPSLPAGFQVLPWKTASDDRWVWGAAREAFEGHWGYSQEPFSILEKRYASGQLERENSFLLWENDQLIGGCLNEMGALAREKFRRNLGWIELVFVRSDWRKRGLGTSLIAAALQKGKDLGHEQVGLNVDADNQTGAVELYTKTGFQVHTTSVIFQRRFFGTCGRDGK